MIYIKKNDASTDVKQKKIKIEASDEWKRINSDETDNLRNMFDSMPKDSIQKALLVEQHYLCAYCMRRIPDFYGSMRIEHYAPLSKHKNKVLDYKNMLGVCTGGDNVNIKGSKRISCCDVSKGDLEISINPQDINHMKYIVYNKKGQIHFKSDNEEINNNMNVEINTILKLNGKLDASSNTVMDTATELVYNRKQVYEQCSREFDRLSNNGRLTRKILEDEVEQMESVFWMVTNCLNL